MGLKFQTQHWISCKFSDQHFLVSYFWVFVHHMVFFHYPSEMLFMPCTQVTCTYLALGFEFHSGNQA